MADYFKQRSISSYPRIQQFTGLAHLNETAKGALRDMSKPFRAVGKIASWLGQPGNEPIKPPDTTAGKQRIRRVGSDQVADWKMQQNVGRNPKNPKNPGMRPLQKGEGQVARDTMRRGGQTPQRASHDEIMAGIDRRIQGWKDLRETYNEGRKSPNEVTRDRLQNQINSLRSDAMFYRSMNRGDEAAAAERDITSLQKQWAEVVGQIGQTDRTGISADASRDVAKYSADRRAESKRYSTQPGELSDIERLIMEDAFASRRDENDFLYQTKLKGLENALNIRKGRASKMDDIKKTLLTSEIEPAFLRTPIQGYTQEDWDTLSRPQRASLYLSFIEKIFDGGSRQDTGKPKAKNHQS